MDYLYGGTILKIDLTNQRVTKEPVSPYAKDFIGGRGINCKIMYDETDPKTNPLDPENVIVFGLGPLTGTLCPGPSRVDVMAKSPVTGFLGNSNMGGAWPAELKYAGYDHMIIKGKAPDPVYITIDNDDIRIRDASEIWGMDTFMTPNVIRQALGDPEAKVICIGKSGENRVSYASILTNIGNAAGRNGMGAVMGAKNLKAIAVRGTKGVRVADPDQFFVLCNRLHNLLKESPAYEEYAKRGSLKSMYASGTLGYAAAGNHQIFDWDQGPEFEKWWEAFGVKRAGCFGCPVQCAETYTIPGIGSGVVSCQHYLEPTWKIKNNDVTLWWEIVRNCQRYGIDVISITGMLAWLMELYEDGIISKEDTDGIPMNWGDRDAIIKIMEKTINREGIGDILAEGFQESIRQFGKKSESYAMHIKNSPLYAPSPRFPLVALEVALGPRGDHMRAFVPLAKGMIRTQADPSLSAIAKEKLIKEYEDQAEKMTGTKKAAHIMEYEGKPEALIHAEKMISVADMLSVCKFMGMLLFNTLNPENLAELLSVGLGKEVSHEELLTAAEKTRNVERAFEVREGLTRKDDSVPQREFNKDIGGRLKGIYLDRDQFEKAKDEYYALRGWDIASGAPTRETLSALGLDDVKEDLERRKLLC